MPEPLLRRWRGRGGGGRERESERESARAGASADVARAAAARGPTGESALGAARRGTRRAPKGEDGVACGAVDALLAVSPVQLHELGDGCGGRGGARRAVARGSAAGGAAAAAAAHPPPRTRLGHAVCLCIALEAARLDLGGKVHRQVVLAERVQGEGASGSGAAVAGASGVAGRLCAGADIVGSLPFLAAPAALRPARRWRLALHMLGVRNDAEGVVCVLALFRAPKTHGAVSRGNAAAPPADKRRCAVRGGGANICCPRLSARALCAS